MACVCWRFWQRLLELGLRVNVALAVAHEERRINTVVIEAAPTAEFAVRAGQQEGHRQEGGRQEGCRRAVPESEQALLLAQPPEEHPFQPGPSIIASTIAKMLPGIKAVTGIEDVLRIKQAVVTT
ncbi:MAG: hypothetical protein O7A06_01495 [Acidobacteria bacterium]|nr:hypothetical protein [Acidobacteriota bacterium]MCZ6753444.1 hypothetical protein [Acidobacteriota bacterium]